MTIRFLVQKDGYAADSRVSTLAPSVEAAYVSGGFAVYASAVTETFDPENVTVVGGNINGAAVTSIRAAVAQYPTARIKVASFGDSYCDIGTVNNTSAQDLRAATSTNGPVGFESTKLGAWLPAFSNGILSPHFNGGIGGQTTTQIAARATTNTSSTSAKNLIDAQAYGCDVVVLSASVNDFLGVTAATSAASVSAITATALTNLAAIVSKANSLGMYVFFHSVMPYGASPVTSDQAAVNAATATYNAQVKALFDASPNVGVYVDLRQYVVAADGGWNPAYVDAAAIHPNTPGAYRIYSVLASTMLNKLGVSTPRSSFPKATNIFSNADLSASSAGLATGITVALANGAVVSSIPTTTLARSQQFVWTPGNATGTDSSFIVDVTLGAAGASPYVPLSAGDNLAMEYDLQIDDGAGNAPAVYQVNTYLMKNAGATSVIWNNVVSYFAGGVTNPFQDPINARIAGGFLTVDEASGASAGGVKLRLSITSRTQGATVRVRISRVRCVKLPSGY